MSVSNKIGVIDYGMGNLRSVSKALEHLGGDVYVGSSVEALSQVGKLVLPGVGAFGDAMRELKKRRLIPLIRQAMRVGKPFFGICLGLQLLFDSSEESPGVRGLGIWDGRVKRFPQAKASAPLKIPHMGWNQVRFTRAHLLSAGLKDQTFFYFVHSFYAEPNMRSSVIGTTRYGVLFPSMLTHENVFAVQFHPEKSQQAGLRILKNFMELKT